MSSCPDNREVTALLALILLSVPEPTSGSPPDGSLKLLPDQDRTRWDARAIAEGTALVRESLRDGPPGKYALLAAINALHDEAPTWEDTDWPQIVGLYDHLMRIWPTPVVELNRAVAIRFADGPAAGLAALDQLADDPRLAVYPYLAAARADCLRELGRDTRSPPLYEEAILLTGNDVERAFLAERLHQLIRLTATFSISSPLGGVLTARFGPRVPLFIGMVLMGAAFLGLRSIGIDTSYNGQWPWFVAVGIALGLIIVASTQAIVGNAPVDKAGVAGGIQQTGFQLGGVIGTSVLGTIIVAGVSAHFADHLAALGVPASAAEPAEHHGRPPGGLPGDRAAGPARAARPRHPCVVPVVPRRPPQRDARLGDRLLRRCGPGAAGQAWARGRGARGGG